MHRFVLKDAQWAKMEPLCLGKPTDPGRTGGDNRLFLEAVLCGSHARAAHGEICRRRSATGIRCSSAIAIGYRPAFSDGFLTPYRMIQTWSSPWSTRQSSKFTAMRRAQKGDQKSGHRQVEGRLDHQNPCADRRTWESGAVHPAPRPSL